MTKYCSNKNVFSNGNNNSNNNNCNGNDAFHTYYLLAPSFIKVWTFGGLAWHNLFYHSTMGQKEECLFKYLNWITTRLKRVHNKLAPWLNSRVTQQMLNRDYLKTKAVKTGSQNNWLSFKKASNGVNYAIKRAKSNYYLNKFNANLGNPKSTWKTRLKKWLHG